MLQTFSGQIDAKACILQNERLLNKICLDTAENGPSGACLKLENLGVLNSTAREHPVLLETSGPRSGVTAGGIALDELQKQLGSAQRSSSGIRRRKADR